jgi:hypothetical protein
LQKFPQFNKNQTCNKPYRLKSSNNKSQARKQEIRSTEQNTKHTHTHTHTQVSPSDEKMAPPPSPPLHQNKKKKKNSCKGLNFRYKKEPAGEQAKRSFVVIFLARSSSRCSFLFFFVRIFAKQASERASERIGAAKRRSKKATEEQQQWT